MNLIVAVDKNWGIGKNNDLLYRIPEDMQFFRRMTLGKTIFMGRKTLESFKEGKPLPKRTNIVLTHNKRKSKYDNLIYVTEEELKTIDLTDAFLIGGSSLYSQFFNNCEYAFITKLDNDEIVPDCYFPNLDNLKNWKIEEILEEGVSAGTHYKMIKYKNLNFSK